MDQQAIEFPEEVTGFLSAHRSNTASIEMGEAALAALERTQLPSQLTDMLRGGVEEALSMVRSGQTYEPKMCSIEFYIYANDEQSLESAAAAIADAGWDFDVEIAVGETDDGELVLVFGAVLPGDVDLFNTVEDRIDELVKPFGLECDGRESSAV